MKTISYGQGITPWHVHTCYHLEDKSMLSFHDVLIKSVPCYYVAIQMFSRSSVVGPSCEHFYCWQLQAQPLNTIIALIVTAILLNEKTNIYI